jgi:O-antigen/teichoic acid export membrane protein
MATSLIVARLVGPSVLGTLAFGLAYVSMFSFISDLGLGTAHIKLIASGTNQADCLGIYARLKLMLITLYVIVVCSVFVVQKYLMNMPFESQQHEIVIFIYLIITVIGQLSTIITSTWAAKAEQAKQDAPMFIQTLLFQVLKLMLALLGFKAIGIAFGNLTAVLLVIPVYLFFARDLKFGTFDKKLMKEYLIITGPIIIIGICQVLVASTDRVILQSMSNSTEVGYYSAAFTLGSFIRTIEGSVGLLLFPYFSMFIANKEIYKINETLKKYERFTFTFIFPGALSLSLFSDLIIHLTYGNGFVSTIPIFSLIVISMTISLASLPYQNILFGMGYFKETALIWVTNLAFFIISAYVFTSKNLLNLTGLGMGIALLLTNIFFFMQLLIYIRRNIKEIRIFPEKIILLFAGAFFTSCFLFLQSIKIESYILKGVLLAISYITFLSLGFIIKLFNTSDIEMIKRMIDLNKMKSYIQTELFRKK